MKNTELMALAISASLLSACGDKVIEKDRLDARKLYKETATITRTYTDSMKNARDSTEIMSLDNRFSEKITEINMDVPPETDAHLSEGENDTLFLLVRNYLAIKNHRLKKARDFKNIEPSDTIR